MHKQLATQILLKIGCFEEVLTVLPLEGGRQHTSYKVTRARTDKCVVIKQLSFDCYWGTSSLKQFEETEQFANYVGQKLGCAIAAYPTEHGYVIHHDSAYYLVYPWSHGQSLDVLTPRQSLSLGKLLASIHELPPLSGVTTHALSVDKPLHLNCTLMCYTTVKKYQQYQALAELSMQAQNQYTGKLVYSHRDMNLENVLWLDKVSPLLIDWESSGVIAPQVELLGLAFNAAGIAYSTLDIACFQAVITGYQLQSRQPIVFDEQSYLQGYVSWLLWLEYCLTNERMEQQWREQEIKRTLDAIELLLSQQHTVVNNLWISH